MPSVKYVTKKSEPVVKEIVVELVEQGDDGVTLMVDGYYICTLENNGTLRLHLSAHAEGIMTNDEGCILVKRET